MKQEVCLIDQILNWLSCRSVFCCYLVAKLYLTILRPPWTVVHQASLSM